MNNYKTSIELSLECDELRAKLKQYKAAFKRILESKHIKGHDGCILMSAKCFLKFPCGSSECIQLHLEKEGGDE